MSEWHARFERDPWFRQAVEAGYGGPHDVADALWWLDHPSADAPSGRPSPRRALAGLQREAFARPSGPGDEARATSARVRLQEASDELERDRAEAQRAVDEAVADVDARPAPRRGPTLFLSGAFIAAACLAGVAAFAATTVIATGAPEVVMGGSVASPGAGDDGDNAAEAATDGAGTGGGSSYSATGGDDSAAGPGAPVLTAAPYPNFELEAGRDAFAAVFTRAQSAADLPGSGANLPDGLLPATFRALSLGQNTPGAVYAAISATHQICLVVYGNPVEYAYTCDEVGVVGTRGLQASLVVPDHRDPATGTLSPAIGLSARWQADGSFILDSSTPYDRD